MDATREEWRPVVDWEGCYEVSDHGRIKSLARRAVGSNGGWRDWPESIRSQCDHRLGYKLVGLNGNGRKVTKHVHVLVLTAFIGPRPRGLVACHNDGNPANNRLNNLRWDTQSSNIFDAVAQGTHPLAAATHCKRGHEYTESSTRYYRGWRRCRECERTRGMTKDSNKAGAL